MGVSLLQCRMVRLSNSQLIPFVFYSEKITSPKQAVAGHKAQLGVSCTSLFSDVNVDATEDGQAYQVDSTGARACPREAVLSQPRLLDRQTAFAVELTVEERCRMLSLGFQLAIHRLHTVKNRNHLASLAS